ADAPVTLVEYGDYECPHCGHAYPIVKALQKRFGRQLRFAFRNFPLREMHPNAEAAAETAEFAATHDKFWEMHDLIYENQQDLSKKYLRPGSAVPSTVEATLQSRGLMTGSSSIAQALSDAVAPHFARHIAAARRHGADGFAVSPDAASIAAMVDAAFWASLRREEGYVPTISLAYLSPEHTANAMRFARPLALEPGALTKIAPAV